MRKLEDRTEIFMAVNLRRYPIVKIDLARFDSYGAIGDDVLIASTLRGEKIYRKGRVRIYKDARKLEIVTDGCTILDDNTGFSSYMELLKGCNAPVIEANSDVLFCIIDSINRTISFEILRTGSLMSMYSINPIELEDRLFEENEIRYLNY